jgi:hypothetical protein
MTTKELCQCGGMTPREVQWWCEHGILKHSYTDTGYYRRHFDETQALVALIVATLRRKGMRLRQVRKLRLHKLQLVTGNYLVTEGSRAVWCDEDAVIGTVLACPAGCYVVSVKDLRARLKPAVARKAVA